MLEDCQAKARPYFGRGTFRMLTGLGALLPEHDDDNLFGVKE